MSKGKAAPAQLLSRAFFNRRLAALLSAFLLFPGSTRAFAASRKRPKPKSAKTTHDTVDAILFYGQSNAGSGGHAQALLTKPVFPDRIYSFRTSRQVYGTRLLDPNRLQGIGSLYDDKKSAPYPATAMAYALGRLAERTPGRLHFMYTVWYGGQPLTSFLRSTTSWSDLLIVADRIHDVLAAKRLRSRIAALVLIQGESGPPGRVRYSRLLHEFLDQVLPDLKEQTGQDRAPVAILLQTNASNVQSATALGVALAQWDVARARPQDTVLAGPMYQLPLSDAVHQSHEGRLMLGDLLALVYESHVSRNRPFEPLHPLAARRANNTIVVSFKRPPDSLPLQWDQTWITPVPNFGFQVTGETGPLPVDAVEITGESEVTIRLAPRAPRNGLIVSYAMDQPRMQGWAPGRGQLTAPTTRRSAFVGLNAKVPETVAHYAIRFQVAVL
jgi:hypothetical protein